MAACPKLRVAVVQFAPKIGEVQANIAKARELCKGLTPRSIDLLCLPEMIFSGTVPLTTWHTRYINIPRFQGATSTFCAELARHLQCHVAAGYPERLFDPTNPGPTQPKLIGANSAVLYGPTGEHVSGYRKTNLFETDLTWAISGTGFSAIHLPAPLGPTTIAICNDLNAHTPAVWNSLEEGPYELAQHCVQSGTRLLVLLNAWLHSGKEEPGKRAAKPGQEDDDPEQSDGGDASKGMDPNWETLDYWAARLRPLWANDKGTQNTKGGHKVKSKDKKEGPEELLVVLCNRFGHERGKTFAGSSAMLSLRRGSGKPRLLHAMGEREEGVGLWTVEIGSHTA
ncbi:carbon-nitrogen hydrolase [Melanogaster broomeanus]|nr:carbon-nitrogen hydrolase [Melanogaster broomeanus]